jgi:hypothetical protein
MIELGAAELRYYAACAFGYGPGEITKVLVIVDGPEGIVAACTESDPDEIRGLMYRAGIALPEGKTL